MYTIDQCFMRPTIEENPAPLPTLVFLHGRDQRGTNLALVKEHGAPRYAAAGTLPAPEPMRVVAPQCPSHPARWGTAAIATGVAQLLGALAQSPSVDGTRLYLTGWSMGGYGVISALTRLQDPLIVAAAAVVSGGIPQGTAPGLGQRLAQVPIRALYGFNDGVVKRAASEALVNELGTSNSSPPIVYPDPNPSKDPVTGQKQGDSAHVLACRHAFSTAELYEWLLTHHR